MSAVTLSSNTIEKWKPTGKAVELWIFSQSAWLTSDGKIKLAGSPEMPGVVKRVICTENANGLTISATAIDSTTDARVNPQVKYLAIFFTLKRNKWVQLRPLDTLPDGFAVPPDCNGWDDLAAYNGQEQP